MKKIKSKVIYSKSSYNHYLKKKDLKKTKKIYPSILRRIIKDINSPNNLFYSFNKNFKLNFSICFSNLNCCKNFFCFSACSILNKACSFLKNNLISLFLCFSNLISSFKACSWSLTFNSCSFCFWFSIEIFSNLSSSCFSNFNLLVSSFLSILYWSIVLAILSKKSFIYFSKFKLILKLNWVFKEFWKVINFRRKFLFIEVLFSLNFTFL